MERKVFIIFLVIIAASCYSQSVQQNQITVEKAIEVYESGNKEQARQMFLTLSKKGDFNADFELGTSKNLSFLEVILRFNLRCFSLSHYDIMT